jgi:HTH-type transcriptional regulator / antitoxin HipB
MAVKIGDIIKSTRKKAGLSQKELADLAGVGKTTVFDIENGKETVRFANIRRICGVLNIEFIMRDPFGNEIEMEN